MAVTPQTPKCHHNLGCASVVVTFTKGEAVRECIQQYLTGSNLFNFLNTSPIFGAINAFINTTITKFKNPGYSWIVDRILPLPF